MASCEGQGPCSAQAWAWQRGSRSRWRGRAAVAGPGSLQWQAASAAVSTGPLTDAPAPPPPPAQVPALSGIGVDAVANCVLALGHTRLYLEPDGMDVRALRRGGRGGGRRAGGQGEGGVRACPDTGVPQHGVQRHTGWHAGLQIRARPEFVHVQKNGAELNALKFNLEVDRI